jgi:hypothetical protein
MKSCIKILERFANQCRGRPACLPRWLPVRSIRGGHAGPPLPYTQLQTALSGIITLSLIFIPGIETNAQGISKAVELKKKGWVRAAYFFEEDLTRVWVFNLAIRHDVYKSFKMNVDFQIPGRKVAAPEVVRITFDSDSAKRRFSDGRLLTIYSGGSKIELTATQDVWRSEREGNVFESVEFLIPYVEFKELIKEKNIKMTLDRNEFDLPGWIRGQLNNMMEIVGN